MISIFTALILIISSILIPNNTKADELYDKIQDTTIEFFENAASKVESFRAGSMSAPGNLNDNQAHFLSGVYLHCAIKNGTCPMILDALLELDVANSRINKKPGCKNLLLFWGKWVENNFESRLNYNISTGHLNKYMQFKKTERAKYIRCSDTVKQEVKSDLPTKEFLKKRYAETSPYSLKISNMSLYLSALKPKVANVFSATGARREFQKSLKK